MDEKEFLKKVKESLRERIGLPQAADVRVIQNAHHNAFVAFEKAQDEGWNNTIAAGVALGVFNKALKQHLEGKTAFRLLLCRTLVDVLDPPLPKDKA
jgi:hypothetical protein